MDWIPKILLVGFYTFYIICLLIAISMIILVLYGDVIQDVIKIKQAKAKNDENNN